MQENLARSRSATASSSKDDAMRAVDGIATRNMGTPACWVAQPDDLDPWWTVDLENFYFINYLEITSRADCAGACGMCSEKHHVGVCMETDISVDREFRMKFTSFLFCCDITFT